MVTPGDDVHGIGQQAPGQHEDAGEPEADQQRASDQGIGPCEAQGEQHDADNADGMACSQQGRLAEPAGYRRPGQNAQKLAGGQA